MRRKLLTITVLVIIFTGYFYIIDPDSDIKFDLKGGVTWLLTLSIIVVSLIGIAIAEFGTDFFKSVIESKIDHETNRRLNSDIVLASANLAAAIRLLGYSIIIAASIIAYSMG